MLEDVNSISEAEIVLGVLKKKRGNSKRGVLWDSAKLPE